METVTLIPPSQESASGSASQGGSQRVTRSQAKKRKVDERSDFEVAETMLPAREPKMPSINSSWMPEEPESQSLPKQDFIPPPPSQKRRITRTPIVPPVPAARSQTPAPAPSAQYRTPQANLSKRKVTPAARVTPWLGGTGTGTGTKLLARTSSKPAMADTEYDPFDDQNEDASPMKAGEPSTALIPGVKTPLIRDRGEGPASSLRRTLLARNMSTTEPGDRSRSRDSASPAPSAGSTDSPRKRLDMTGLTPQQVAQERKKISKMTPAEKKVLYAEYKGKGRYLRPDEV
jgi:hypothetical protein